MTKEQAKKAAEDVFARFKEEGNAFVTADGQVFFDEKHAQNHARSNRGKKELEVFTFLRSAGESKDEGKTIKGEKA